MTDKYNDETLEALQNNGDYLQSKILNGHMAQAVEIHDQASALIALNHQLAETGCIPDSARIDYYEALHLAAGMVGLVGRVY
jgi:hypothetical protein